MREKSMNSTLAAEENGRRTFVLILEPGEEAFTAISRFAAEKQIDGASLTALGAFERAKVGWFDPAARKYYPIPINEQCEVLSVIGDIAKDDDGKPSLHVHVVLGMQDGTTRGGHLMEGIVRPTLEVVLVETAVHLRRRKHADLGVALIEFP